MTESEKIEIQVFAYKALKNNNQAFFVDNHEDAERIINALEKQIPKKPIKDQFSRECCPNCSWIVYKDEYGGRYLPHCENCGQAIDWSDEE